MTAEVRDARHERARPDLKWFPLWRPVANARARLLCLPCAGGGASIFHVWRRLLPDVEILAAQLPGREHRVREAPIRDLGTLVDSLSAALSALPESRPEPLPLAVLGHSVGAVVAFALCRALPVSMSPCRLFVAAGRAPHRPPRRILNDLPLTALLDELVRIGGTSPQALREAEIVELVEPVLRADLFLAETNILSATPALEIPINVFGGTDDRHVIASDLEAWNDLTVRGCSIEYVPGGHFFVRDQAPDVARRVRSLLP